MGPEEYFLWRVGLDFSWYGCNITWGFLWRGVGTTLAQGGEEEKKEPRREKGEKALWGEEGAGKSRRGRRGRKRGEALRGREATTREGCMVQKSARQHACIKITKHQHALHASSWPVGHFGATGETIFGG